MKILITGTTGYVGKRLIHKLLDLDHELYCCVRDKERIPDIFKSNDNITIIEIDFLDSLDNDIIPKKIDVAYYLIHSMSSSSSKFESLEEQCQASHIFKWNSKR